MITITHKEDAISIRGHANYAEHGKDIVCAGVSTLIQTLIQSFEEISPEDISYDMSPGKVDIYFRSLTREGAALVSSFFIGVKLIANEYPENVKLTEP